MNKRTLDAIQKLSELPDDGWEPYTWDVFLTARTVLVEEADRVNRRASRKRTSSGATMRSRKPADGPTAATKAAVSERSRGWCEVGAGGCRVKPSQLHHRLMRSQGGGHEADNLLAVCSPCHEYVHQHPEYAFERGCLLHRVTA